MSIIRHPVLHNSDLTLKILDHLFDNDGSCRCVYFRLRLVCRSWYNIMDLNKWKMYTTYVFKPLRQLIPIPLEGINSLCLGYHFSDLQPPTFINVMYHEKKLCIKTLFLDCYIKQEGYNKKIVFKPSTNSKTLFRFIKSIEDDFVECLKNQKDSIIHKLPIGRNYKNRGDNMYILTNNELNTYDLSGLMFRKEIVDTKTYLARFILSFDIMVNSRFCRFKVCCLNMQIDSGGQKVENRTYYQLQ